MVRVTDGPGRPGTAIGRAKTRKIAAGPRGRDRARNRAGLRPAGMAAAWTLAACLACEAAVAGGLTATDGMQPPPGWETAFEDGRLNPHRGRGTAAGSLATSRLWTDTVPRRARPGADIAHGAEAGPPPGYANAFDDGRLNPRRGLGTAF